MSQRYVTKLRQEREFRGWSRDYVAEQVNVEPGTIGRWERGESLPQPHYRQKLCALFMMNAQELGLLQFHNEYTHHAKHLDLAEDSKAAENTEDSVVSNIAVITKAPPQEQCTPPVAVRRSLLWKSASRRSLMAIGITAGTSLVGGGAIILVKTALRTASSRPERWQTSYARRLDPPLYDPRSAWVNNMAWAPDESYLAVATGTRAVVFWDVVHHTYHMSYEAPLRPWIAPAYHVNDVSWHQSSLIAAACADKQGHGRLCVWSFPGAHLILDLPVPPLIAVAWAPSKKVLAYGGNTSSTIKIFDPIAKRQLRAYSGHDKSAEITCIRWSSDGSFISSADNQGQVHIWNAQTGERIRVYTRHQQEVRDISWSPSGDYIATASYDTTVQIWNPFSGQSLYTYDKHTDAVHAVSWFLRGDFLASGGEDKAAHIWQWNKKGGGKDLFTCDKHSSAIHSIAWAPASPIVAVGYQEPADDQEKGGIELWTMITRE